MEDAAAKASVEAVRKRAGRCISGSLSNTLRQGQQRKPELLMLVKYRRIATNPLMVASPRPKAYFQSSSDLVAHSGSAGFTWQRMRLMTFRPRLSYRPCCDSCTRDS